MPNAPNPDDIATIMYTSGTTGEPKVSQNVQSSNPCHPAVYTFTEGLTPPQTPTFASFLARLIWSCCSAREHQARLGM